MAKEVLNLVDPQKGDIIVDATFGFGGHSLKIIERENEIKIIGIEKDSEIFEIAKEKIKDFKNINLIRGDFQNIDEILKNLGIKKINKIIFDFGISSYHLEHSKRGFSFKRDEVLDMRYNIEENQPLWKKLRKLRKEEIEKIIKEYGEEPYYKKIALNIFKERQRIKTTWNLNKVIEKSVHPLKRNKAKQRVYQAFRIFINRELEKIRDALEKAHILLKSGGRIICLSYHSLEDRIVKNFFKEKKMKILTPKPFTPSPHEIEENPRARSCKLRCAEKA